MKFNRLTDEQLRKYDDPDSELFSDDLHKHFEATKLTNWLEISDEGVRILSLILDLEIEDESPEKSVIEAVAARAYDGAMQICARAFGFDNPHSLLNFMFAMEKWEDDGIGWGRNSDEEMPPPLASLEELGLLVSRRKKR